MGSSRNDEAPIFEAIIRHSQTLCNAPMAGLILATAEDEAQRLVAQAGIIPRVVELFETGQMKVDPSLSYAARCITTCALIAWPDMGESDLYKSGSPIVRSMVDDSNIRSVLFVPLVQNGAAIGLITLFREKVHPFSYSEIALIETFAAQAVIAIENTRQFREVQTRLEHEQASAEILQTISQSRADEDQVFDVILQKAAALCQADQSALILANEARTSFYLAANWGHARTAFEIGKTWPFESMLTAGVAIRAADVVNIADYAETERYKSGDLEAIQMVENEGIRSRLVVPLMRGDIAIGAIALSRRKVMPFKPREIALIQTFAAQAVIAIENTRQFKGMQEALVREQANAEVLQVISEATSDLQPVFDLIVQKAAELSGARFCVLDQYKDGKLHFCAQHGFSGALITKMMADYPVSDFAGHVSSMVIDANGPAHIEDAQAATYYAPETAIAAGWRRMLGIPIKIEGQVWGCITMGWPGREPPSAEIIELIQSFAAQASIAIANVRLMRETQARTAEVEEALEQQHASAEILSVISQSVEDTQPVFETILESCQRLISCTDLSISTIDNDGLVTLAAIGGGKTDLLPKFGPRPLAKSIFAGTFERDGIIHYPDVLNGPDVPKIFHGMSAAFGNNFSCLLAPMMRDGKPVGGLFVTRNLEEADVKPFTARDMELLETFADQAVIAIQNARLFNETQTALIRQTASADILRVISGAQKDVLPVFNTICEAATALLASDLAFVMTSDGKTYSPVAGASPDGIISDLGPQDMPIDPELNFPSRAFQSQSILHLPDWTEIDLPPHEQAIHERYGVNSALYVPLTKAGELLGLLVFARRQKKAYSSPDISLAETFADQAVIAIQNARLFNETQTALSRQTASADVLRAISQSPTDVQPVMETIVSNATQLIKADMAVFHLRHEEHF